MVHNTVCNLYIHNCLSVQPSRIRILTAALWEKCSLIQYDKEKIAAIRLRGG